MRGKEGSEGHLVSPPVPGEFPIGRPTIPCRAGRVPGEFQEFRGVKMGGTPGCSGEGENVKK